MPRGRPKMIGPKLPKGGYRSLITKKKLAETARLMAAVAAPAMMARARGRGRPRSATSTSAFNRASPAKRAEMLSKLTGTLNYKKPIGPRRRATAAQLAALARARAVRAERRGAVARTTGPVLAYGQYF